MTLLNKPIREKGQRVDWLKALPVPYQYRQDYPHIIIKCLLVFKYKKCFLRAWLSVYFYSSQSLNTFVPSLSFPLYLLSFSAFVCVCVCVWVCLLLGRLISKLKQLLLFPKILYHSFHLLIFFFLPRWVITLLPRITTKSSTSPLTFLLKTVPNASTTTAVSIEQVPSFPCPVSSALLPLFYFTLLI